MDISIIIVNFNTFELTKACVESVLKSLKASGLTGEILIVDNASSDRSGEKLVRAFENDPNVRVLLSAENLGFSGGNNLALKEAKGDFLLLLNSDTLVEKDTIKRSVDYLRDHPEYSALGCKVLLEDGTLDPACKRSFPTPMGALYHFLKLDSLFPNSKRFGAYNLTYLDEDEVHEVECLTGAFLLFRREAYEEIGGLSEDYFMYCEDNDYCYRLIESGHKIVYYPGTKITHFKKKSWNAKKNPEILDAFYDSMLIFYDKHYKDKYSPFTHGAVILGVNTFKQLDHLKNYFKKEKT